MVTIFMMIVVLFALYSIFDMSIRVFDFGNDKTEAIENARVGLEKMEREIRAASLVDRANNKNYRFFSASDATKTNNMPTNAPASAMPSATPPRITFGNDLDGNQKVQCISSTTCEYITYKLAASNNPSSPCTSTSCQLVRNNTVTGTSLNTGNQPVANNVSAVAFTPLTANGGTPSNEAEIGIIRVALEISVPGNPPRTQPLTTDVTLRNKSNP